MGMEIARPKSKENSISSGYSGQRDLNTFAHEISNSTVNSGEEEESRYSGTENERCV